MIPKEVLAQIRRIHIVTSRMVTDVFAGRYQSVFKGRGIEFDEVRQYFVGDDVRCIDWNVTARTGIPYVKKFVEERELTVVLILDLSPSSYFGTREKLKRQLATEICSLLTFSAMQNNDKVGLLIFTDQVEKFVPPRKGVRHGMRILREALYFQPKGRGTDISQALEYFNKVCRRKTISFIISDFYAQGFEKPLSIANKHHDIIAVILTDPREIELPNVGIVSLNDPESGEKFLIDTSNPKVRERFYRKAKEIRENRKKIFSRLGIDTIDVRTDVPYAKALFLFFRRREKRRGR